MRWKKVYCNLLAVECSCYYFYWWYQFVVPTRCLNIVFVIIESVAVAFHHFVILTPPWWFRRTADSDLCTVMYSVHMCCTYVNCLCLARLTWFWHDRRPGIVLSRPGIVLSRPPPMCAGCAPMCVYVDVEQWEANLWKLLGRRSIELQTFCVSSEFPTRRACSTSAAVMFSVLQVFLRDFGTFYRQRQHSVNVVAMAGSRIATYNGNNFKCISAAK